MVFVPPVTYLILPCLGCDLPAHATPRHASSGRMWNAKPHPTYLTLILFSPLGTCVSRNSVFIANHARAAFGLVYSSVTPSGYDGRFSIPGL